MALHERDSHSPLLHLARCSVGLSVDCTEMRLCALLSSWDADIFTTNTWLRCTPKRIQGRSIRHKGSGISTHAGLVHCLLLSPHPATVSICGKATCEHEQGYNTGHSDHVQALLRDQNKKSPAEAASTASDVALAADTSNSEESKSAEDLVPISAWLGSRNGAAESMPEPEMASDQSSNGIYMSASTSQSTRKVSPEGPEATSSSAIENSSSQTEDIPYTAAQAQEEQVQTSARPVQDSGWGQQDGILADEQGYYNRGPQPAGSSSSERAAELTDIPDSARRGYTEAAPLASNGNHVHRLCSGCAKRTL